MHIMHDMPRNSQVKELSSRKIKSIFVQSVMRMTNEHVSKRVNFTMYIPDSSTFPLPCLPSAQAANCALAGDRTTTHLIFEAIA